MDPADEVEVPNIERTIRAAGQCHRGKQHHVPGRTTAAWTTGDAAVETIAHYGADDRGLLREKDVFPISLVKDSWGQTNAHRFNNEAFKASFLSV